MSTERKIRVLVAKPGLDGHDRGAKVIARALRDAGMEVIYTGLRQTPEMIVNSSLQEDVDVIGLSILSGAHNAIVPRVTALLRQNKMEDVILLVGGIIPEQDFDALKKAGERHHPVNLTTNDNTTSDDCSVRLRVSSSDFGSTYRDEATSAVSNQPLTIRGERNGGIQVTTWDQPQFSIKLCKQVVADNESVARRVLQETKLQISGGDVSVTSPESSDDYSLGTLILVKAPRGATVSLSVHNGGISLRKFEGTP